MMGIPRLSTIALSAVLSGHGIAVAKPHTTVNIGAIKDNTLYEDTFGGLSNGSGEYLFSGRVNLAGGGLIRRGLVAFDVAGSIPSGVIITDATLTLYMTRTSAPVLNTGIHRLLRDFGEGPSDAFGQEGTGAVAASPDATWIHASTPAPFWSTPGGDFTATPSASIPVAGVAAYAWNSAGLLSDVQFWFDRPDSNFGWIVIGDESITRTAKRFASRENFFSSRRPYLTVTYRRPDTVKIVAELDNTLYEDSSGALSNGLGDHLFVGRTSQLSNSLRRGLLRFDIGSEVRPGATILEASVSMYQSKSASEMETVNLHRTTAFWGEGTSDAVGAEGGGAVSTPGDATWLHSQFPDMFWAAAGGDFTAAPTASLEVDSSLRVHTWQSTGLATDVQNMLDNPLDASGWIVRGNEDSAGTAKRFDTHDHDTASHHPLLTVISVGGQFPCPVLRTGDIDQNGFIGSSDIIGLVEFVFKSGPIPQPCVASGDVNCTARVTSSDIIYQVNFVFKGGPAPCDVCSLIPETWTCE